MLKDDPTTLYIYPGAADIDAIARAVAAGQSLSRAGLYWNVSCLKEIHSPKFWPREALDPILAQYKKDHPAPPQRPMPICKGRWNLSLVFCLLYFVKPRTARGYVVPISAFGRKQRTVLRLDYSAFWGDADVRGTCIAYAARRSLLQGLVHSLVLKAQFHPISPIMTIIGAKDLSRQQAVLASGAA
jgi:hypothetical protein